MARKRKKPFDTANWWVRSARWQDYKLRVVLARGSKRVTVLIHRADIIEVLDKAEQDARAQIREAKANLAACRGSEADRGA